VVTRHWEKGGQNSWLDSVPPYGTEVEKQKNRFMRFTKHRIDTAVVTNGMINPSSGRLNTGWQN
jgi:hypothetical protein